MIDTMEEIIISGRKIGKIYRARKNGDVEFSRKKINDK